MARLIGILLLLSTFVLPARTQDKCRIHVTLPAGTHGGYAYLHDWDVLSQFSMIDSMEFKGRRFTFDVECREQPFMAMIRTFNADDSVGLGGTLIIIEQGDLDFLVNGKDDIMACGTPLNDAYYQQVTIPWRQHRANKESGDLQRAIDSEKAFMYANMHLPGVASEYVYSHSALERPDISLWPCEYVDLITAKWAEFDAMMDQMYREKGLSESQIEEAQKLLDAVRKKRSVPQRITRLPPRRCSSESPQSRPRRHRQAPITHRCNENTSTSRVIASRLRRSNPVPSHIVLDCFVSMALANRVVTKISAMSLEL